MKKKYLVSILAVSITGIIAFCAWSNLINFEVQSKVYDNVPNYAECEYMVAKEKASDVAISIRSSVNADVLLKTTCGDKYLLEIQYGSHEIRKSVEKNLSSIGRWEFRYGWFVDGVPVSLRNV